MSFQYINSHYMPQLYPQQYINQGMTIPIAAQYSYIPQYDYSFYAQNNALSAQYPYNSINNINSKGYVSLGQAQSPDGSTVHLFKLSNGQQVAIMPKKDEATIIKTFIDAGSINELDEHRGVMHVIEHGAFKGSKKFQDGDVFRLTGLMGASTNASTDFANVDYYITAPYLDENSLKTAAELQGDMVYNMNLEKDAMESEKGPVCSEISMMNDDPSSNAFDKVIRNLFQIKSDSKNLVAGSISTVQNLSTEDMKNYHSAHYAPEKLRTVVVGDVDVQKTIDLIAKNFKSETQREKSLPQFHMELNPINKSIREDIISPRTNSTRVFLGFCGPEAQNTKDFIIASMLDFYLSRCSSSTFKETLEKNNASHSMSFQKVGLGNTPYAIVNMMSLNPNDEQVGIDAFYDAIQKLQTEYLSDNEMSAVVNYALKDIEIKMCDSATMCEFISNSLLNNNFSSFANYKQIAASITKQDIMDFARKYYDLNKASIVVVHPAVVSEKDVMKNYSKSKYLFRNNKSVSQVAFCGNKKINTNDVKEFQLANKTRLAINKTSKSLCVFNWCVNTPPIKPKNPTIPMVLRHMFESGTDYKNQKELEEYKQLNAIDAYVYVNGRSIEINADCLPQQADKTLALIKELMYHPNLTQNDFEKAKKYVKDTLLASSKDAHSNLLDKTYPGFFPTRETMLKAIDDLTLDDVKMFYHNLLTSATSTFVATLPENNINELTSDVIKNQSTLEIQFKEAIPELTPIFSANPAPTVIYDTDDLNQAQIYKSYKFPLSGNIEDEIKFEMVNTILGGTPNSRLFKDLREKQNLAYHTSSSIQSFENTGILTLAIQTTTDHQDQNVQSYDNVKKSLDGFKYHTDKLCTELVSDEELAAAKMKLKQSLIGQCQDPYSETDLLAMNILEPYGIKRIDKYFEAIDKMTKQDVMKAAKYIFSFNPTTSILASENTINSQMDYLKTQGDIIKAA